MNRQKSFENEKPTLYLVATPIGNLSEMSERAIHTLKEVDMIAAEDTRNTMKLLQHFSIQTRVIAHHMHNEFDSAKGLIKLLEENKNIALVSDAGYPLLSDPGQYVVQEVIAKGFNVVPISGANAALNALVASGLKAQPFLFYGFLGNSEKERTQALQSLKEFNETMIFYEAPHRIEKMLTSALTILGNRKICLAREITKKHEEFIRGTIQEVLEIMDSIKGEMVIVIEGANKEKEVISLMDLNVIVERHIEEGLSSKEAIKKVSKEYGVSRNDLYNQFHNLQS